MQKTVKLTLAYHGAGFKGWQTQGKRERTAQLVLEEAVQKVAGVKTPVTGASRTDAGVHAESQVAHFKLTTRLSARQIRNALNFYLPEDMVVKSASFVPAGFHARFMARRKVYRYRILNSPVKPVFGLDAGLWIPQTLDIAAMQKAASALVGRHDFSAFAGPDDTRENRERTLWAVRVKRLPGRVIEVILDGSGFLHHMVRLIVGTLVEVGRGKRSAAEVAEILRSRDRRRSGVMVKAHGLCLLKIYY